MTATQVRAAAVLASALLVAAPVGADPVNDGPTTAAPAASGTAVGDVLLPIPVPDLATAEPAVQETLRAAREGLDRLLARGDTTDTELAKAFGEMGQFYHAHHVYIPAQPCYRNAEALAPEEFRWPYYLGYLLQQTSQPEAAAASFERARRLRPDDPLTQYRLADAYLGLNRPQAAEALLQPLVGAADLRAAALYGLGRAALAQRRFDEAARWLEQALAEQPQATRIHYPLAMAYRGLGQTGPARAHLAQYGDGEPAFPDPLIEQLEVLTSGVRTKLYRAIAAAHAGHYAAAATSFREALALDPENVNARVSLARSLFLIGDRAGAREALEEALRRDPKHDLGQFLLGVLLEEQGDDAAAMARYRAALAANPDHGGAQYFLANELMRQGQFAEAAAHYRRAVALVPRNLPARLLEALALVRNGPTAHAEARERLEQASREAPDETMFSQPLARLLAASPVAGVRDGGRAVQLAGKLFDQFDSLDHAETLAMAQAEVGRFEDAAALQRNAVEATAAAGRLDLLPPLQENLSRYESGQPCRRPWADDDPIFQPPPIDAVTAFRNYPTVAAY